VEPPGVAPVSLLPPAGPAWPGGKHLVGAVPMRRRYRLADVPCALSWKRLQRLLAVVDRREVNGHRDYAMLLLTATYGRRSCEVRVLRHDDINGRHFLGPAASPAPARSPGLCCPLRLGVKAGGENPGASWDIILKVSPSSWCCSNAGARTDPTEIQRVSTAMDSGMVIAVKPRGNATGCGEADAVGWRIQEAW
jgi:hypothetical protein